MGSDQSSEEYKKLVNEIAKGMDQVKQQLLKAASSSGNKEGALEKRLTSYEEALSILNEMDPLKYKRKRAVETITRQARADSDVPPDDGYNWRKYGQKAILGLKYPRCYFRCYLRNIQGCLATKQVRRLDDDDKHSVFEIIYRSTHTCVGPAPKFMLEDEEGDYSPPKFMLDEHEEDSSFIL